MQPLVAVVDVDVSVREFCLHVAGTRGERDTAIPRRDEEWLLRVQFAWYKLQV